MGLLKGRREEKPAGNYVAEAPSSELNLQVNKDGVTGYTLPWWARKKGEEPRFLKPDEAEYWYSPKRERK